MDKYFKRLEEIYEDFDREYFRKDIDNTCKACELCCTSTFRYPDLSALEYDYLKKYVKENNISPSVDNFKNFFQYKDSPYCPYWSKEKGCRVYLARPMFCRMFGLFRFEGDSELPKSCVFYGKRIDVTDESRYKIIKNLPEYMDLIYKYGLLKAENKEEKLEILIKMGKDYITQSRLEEALSILSEVEKIDPHNVSVLFDLAFIYREMNKPEKSKEKLERSIYLGGEEKYPYIHQHYGFVCLTMNCLEEAHKAFMKAIELEPDSMLPYLGMALFFSVREENVKALEYCRKALEINPQDPVALNLGQSILKL